MENRFEALSRICLNNWHYIQHKVLSFHDGVNFLTGHSGSGKSTVIDALQVVLYANTDGRGFFNKAAADDSDRNLIEYLRGMVNIEENNEFAYLRNSNFSTTIVLELRRTDTDEYQSIGVVFDVETSNNEISRLFFWHKGRLHENFYRTSKRTMTIQEVKDWLTSNYSKEDCYFGSHNERFRKQLYDIYLGGLDSEKFPLLFKRAIPFKMNIKLEEFVKEYICMEQDIHIEDMQESVMQYGRMRKKIEDALKEIEKLKEICEQYKTVKLQEDEIARNQYFISKVDLLHCKEQVLSSQNKIKDFEASIQELKRNKDQLDKELKGYSEKSDELLRQIAATGYEELKAQLININELIERLTISKSRWEKVAEGLRKWEELDVTSNPTAWLIDDFAKHSIKQEEIEKLQKSIHTMRKEIEEQKNEEKKLVNALSKEQTSLQEELNLLKLGNKAYPRELEDARRLLTNHIFDDLGISVQIDILADLLEIQNDEWRNAIEGYLGNNKLTLIVEPKHARTVMQYYQKLDKEKYYRVSVLDTEKVMKDTHPVLEGSLTEEVVTTKDYVKAYMDFMLGKVMKCDDIDELRSQKIGITKDCVLYHSYKIQHINPENYTKYSYIGKHSVRKRMRLIEERLDQIEVEKKPHENLVRECEQILTLESLPQELQVYLDWDKDIRDLSGKQKEKKKLEEKLSSLEVKNAKALEEERNAILELHKARSRVQEDFIRTLSSKENLLDSEKETLIILNETLVGKEREFKQNSSYEKLFQEAYEKETSKKYEVLLGRLISGLKNAQEKKDLEHSKLLDLRTNYLRSYVNRNFSVSAEDNKEYEELLTTLSCDRLEEYRQRASEQAKAAVIHFKDDFMYKIRSAILEAVQRKDELNRIISKLDFGKDKYQFYIGKNKGIDGQYYDMFMDESLEVNPAKLGMGMENQINLFTMEHEESYGSLINDLINIFIPPDNATPEELEEAKRNMDKYADYRTYLSFDMQQIIKGEDETIKIQLSKMIKKNSGGEGQNPLYVALLASFAQAYRIGLNPKIKRPPTIRLVVLDEAFSKMDAEKVASCIKLMRGLGFQALISATNDKIQNYLETVDKIFVFANPNKKCISIQEFEKTDFSQLARDLEDDEFVDENHQEA